jgi:hypothetical protein
MVAELAEEYGCHLLTVVVLNHVALRLGGGAALTRAMTARSARCSSP